MAAILKVAIHSPKKTQIMYQANLSFQVLQKYLSELINASMICFQDEDQCYTLATKGRLFLEEYKEYSKINKHVEKALTQANVKKENLERLFTNS